MQVERTVTLPVNDNQGNSVNQAHRLLTETILEHASGYTTVMVGGVWQENGVLFHDTSVRYSTICSPEASKRIAQAIPNVCLLAKQECVLTTERQIQADFVTAPALEKAS